MHDIETKKETTQIIIVSTTGKLIETEIVTNTITSIKELTEILSNKCGHKKSTGYSCYHTWRFRNRNNRFGLDNDSDTKYIYIDLWAKTDGRAGQENKYEIPPPIDEILFFGNIALVARVDKENACNLTLKKWSLVYENLFGGFEDLSATAKDDENEIDELDLVPASQKTKAGYLKDGFIVEDRETSSGSDASNKIVRKKENGKKKTNNNKVGNTDSESEFVTETETESTTPLSSCELDSNEDEQLVVNTSRNSNKKISKPKIVKNKPIIDDEDDDELVEEQYDTV